MKLADADMDIINEPSGVAEVTWETGEGRFGLRG